MQELSKAEEITLLAVWRAGENAYGVSIRDQILNDTGKEYTYGTLYGFLRQLASKGLVQKRMGEVTPEKGGRRKAYFDLTDTGRSTLKEAIRFHRQVWKDLDELSLDRI
ncbi:helix-turn-helix transcriptional regulator [bacterium]|nr:helix-turn-helix transcriptional regulator [bacterium]